MTVVAETGRLLLRRIQPSDAGDFFELSRNPQVLRYTGLAPMQKFAEAQALVASLIERYEQDGFGRWAVQRRKDGEFLGWCGLRTLEGEGVDLGYWLHPRHWGRGYAKEAARASVELGFGEFSLPYLIGRAVADNVASCTVLERLGFAPWYRMSGWGYDDVRYTILPHPDAPKADPTTDVVAEHDTLRARLLQPADQLDFFMLEGNPNVLRYADGEQLDFEAAGRGIARLRATARDPEAALRVFAVSAPGAPFLGTVATVATATQVEIGFRILETHWGQGLGRPTATLALALARRLYPERSIHACCDLRNHPSLRILGGLGGTRDGDRNGHAHWTWPAASDRSADEARSPRSWSR